MADAGDRGCRVRKLAREFWRCLPYALRADRTLGFCYPTSPVQEIFPVSAKDSGFPDSRSQQCRALERSHNWGNSYDQVTLAARDSDRHPVKML